jgi:IMP dehydrogenase
MSSLQRFLTFDDVGLVPQFSDVRSRSDTNLATNLSTLTPVAFPWVPSNMDSVIGTELATYLTENGGAPIFHRFTDMETRKEWVRKFPNGFQSCGVTAEQTSQTNELIAEGATKFCLDIAHGHAITVEETIRQIKEKVDRADIIAGNVCTVEGYHYLADAGATAVKIGVGPGAACTTRIVTGFGVPQFSAIRNIAEVAKIPLIADGGIRSSREACLALAAGASTVMMGKLFAATAESASKKVVVDGKMKAEYRGQASAEFQNEFYGPRSGIVPEGVKFSVPVSGPASELVSYFNGALRSSFTYAGARTMQEFHKNAVFFECTYAYVAESHPRPN